MFGARGAEAGLRQIAGVLHEVVTRPAFVAKYGALSIVISLTHCLRLPLLLPNGRIDDPD